MITLLTVAYGQAWTPDPGHGYVQAGVSTWSSQYAFERNGRRRLSERFDSLTGTLYADIGVVRRLAVRTSLPLTVATTSSRTPKLGAGNAFVGVRAKLTKSISVEWTHHIPLVDGRTRPLHTDRIWSTGLSVHAGGGFDIDGHQGWIQAEVGGRLPLAFGPDSAKGRIATRVDTAVSGGVWWAEHSGLQLRASGYAGIRSTLDDVHREQGFVSFASTPPSSAAVDTSVTLMLRRSEEDPWLGQVGFTRTLAGSDTGQGTSWSVSVGRNL